MAIYARLKKLIIHCLVIFWPFFQVKTGTIFDNFLITDDVDEAEKFGTETWGATKVIMSVDNILELITKIKLFEL